VRLSRLRREQFGGCKTDPKAPDAFLIDLENVLKLIASHPEIGVIALNVRLAGVRRIHMARIRYHLYYPVTSDPQLKS